MPSLKLGNNAVTTVKIGNTQVNKVYLGATEIWSSWSPSDPNAATYINTMNALPGVTLTLEEKQAVDELFIRMKGNDPLYSNYGNAGIWNAAKAFYPYVGANLEAYRYNAINPISTTTSTDAAGYPNAPGYQYIAGGVTVDGIYGPKGNSMNGVILSNLNWMGGTASSLSPTNLCMGAGYKTEAPTGRDDFGEYNPNVNMAGIFLRTGGHSPGNGGPIARLGCLENGNQNITGPNVVIGGRGHWMLHRTGNDRRAYYKGVQATYTPGQDRAGEGSTTYNALNTWTFLALNFNYFNGVGAAASLATRAAYCVAFSGNTLLFNYVMDGFSNTLIPAWNQMIEAFCVKTGKKTWA
jgi:hypothetical protein